MTEEEKSIVKDKEGKEGSFAPLIIFMFISLILAGLWVGHWIDAAGPVNGPVRCGWVWSHRG